MQLIVELDLETIIPLQTEMEYKDILKIVEGIKQDWYQFVSDNKDSFKIHTYCELD